MTSDRQFSSLCEQLKSRESARRGWIYEALGVRPIINCAGTRSSFGGSNPTALVMNAMKAAGEGFVDMDELAEGVGRYIARLIGAEWGIVTAGSVAALALSTAACIAGNEPVAMTRLPKTGALKNRVLIPQTHRFPYDSVMTTVGAELVPFESLDALEKAAETACMVCFLGRAEATDRKMSLEEIRRRVGHLPIVVDAAGLSPGTPDPWLSRGATLAIYSGGKYLRGPQSSGLLVGSERLARAAWANGPPHLSFGRSMKVGKEEIIGAVVALEAWLTPSLRATDERRWYRLLKTIVSDLPADLFRASIQPSTWWALTPRLQIGWDDSRVKADQVVARMLRDFQIQLPDFHTNKNVVVIDPFNIVDHEQARLVSGSLTSVFRDLQSEIGNKRRAAGREPDRIFSGSWNSVVTFAGRIEEHAIELMQKREEISGVYRSTTFETPVKGYTRGDDIYLLVKYQVDQMELHYHFEGRRCEDRIKGVVHLGGSPRELRSPSLFRQFGDAEWNARLVAQHGT
ncbi:hypothetical protein [Chelatococcus asaccharovorans]|uniref:L-seryl-tRNA(Ser) seleniumtransferase n=1 Tax=Chelatococcus asaccharovorans TaxID=28210 RepID=A0A2V3U873_9HYPH|nr:hypothetical protein [Chelatococcus asaccharovorans]MBS7705584.1 hypothetical protein [Chelatococcus asaccharovorans]PXW60005.1 hypothetical protein C7450_10455 [Chelatococcus asaccharovorans]